MITNDEPTLSDQLDRQELLKEAGETIATCTPPQVFGVHGDWGLGKTSFLHQLQYYLTGECPQHAEDDVEQAALPRGEHKHVTVVCFEAWRYQHEDVPVVALLHEIRAQLDWRWKFVEKSKKISEVAFRGALMSLEDLTKKIGFQASKIQAAGEKWEQDHLAMALPSHTIREQLQQAIDHLLPKPKKPKGNLKPRVAVLIDDLDRCEPSAAYRLLEGLKIYLTIPNCVFVLGMNQKVIEDAIAKELPTTSQSEDAQVLRAGAYLEKLCQNVWRLPLVRDPAAFLDDVMKTMENKEESRPIRSWVKGAIETWSERTPCLPPNPRRLKALANVLERLSVHLPPRSRQEDYGADDPRMCTQAALMLVVAYVYQFHHDLFHRWEKDPAYFDRLAAWVQGGASDQEPLLPARVQPERPVQITPPQLADEPRPPDSLHPDPTEANIFWIQPLLYGLAQAGTYSDDFKPYLWGREKQ